ncbi:MAG: hypothetical protein E6J90_29535 [Deltaproteobacteria bacterium]|nr:MAG: hypothetical protein E6J90_29535 [Deltaproteobacteria bacterium]
MSFRHQILVELFRNCGELAPELLRRCAGIDLDHRRTEIGSADLSHVESPDYRADSVVVLHGEDDAIRSAVIVEVQLATDPTKLRSWPVYVTTVRARLDCATVLLVLTSTGRVARWARRPIATGHPGFILVPVVLDFHDLPRIIDPRAGRKLLYGSGLFGRNTPGKNAAELTALRESGFTTVILWTIHVDPDGTLVYNNTVIVRDGVFAATYLYPLTWSTGSPRAAHRCRTSCAASAAAA